MKYTKEIIEGAVQNKISMAEVLRGLNLRLTGGNYSHMKHLIIKFNVDISHLLGRKHMLAKKGFMLMSKEEFISNQLTIWKSDKTINTHGIKKKLFRYALKENKCEVCGIESWLEKPISLQLHHMDGNRWNNNLENLQILCPNCHTQTDTHSGKKNKIEKLYKTEEELYTIRSKAKYGTQRKTYRPPYSVLKEEVKKTNYSATGRKYGVSDNCIRKWLKMYEKHGEEANLVEALD